MEVPFWKWYAVIPSRISRRRFDPSALEPGMLTPLRTVCLGFRPFPQARAELVTQSPDAILGGVTGSYGMIKGATAFIAFIGDMDDPHIQEKVGYMGEGIVLEATAQGLGTCWVGGTFRRRAVSAAVGIGRNEKVLAVTPIGFAAQEHSAFERVVKGTIRSRRRKPLAQMVSGLGQDEWPKWVRFALEAARLAPSAINRQPWRFHVEPRSITVSVDSPRLSLNISKRLDCGIAMMHIEAAALEAEVRGGWEFLASPQVARFTLIDEG